MRGEHDANLALIPKTRPTWEAPARGHVRPKPGGGRGCKRAWVVGVVLATLAGCGGGGCDEACERESTPTMRAPPMPCAASKVCMA